MSIRSPNQQFQRTEENTKYWPQPVAFLHQSLDHQGPDLQKKSQEKS